jgi:hypothetical protein
MLVFSYLGGENATLPNCGDTLKLQVPSRRGNTVGGQGNDLGYGKNLEDVTIGNPQPSPKSHYFAQVIWMLFTD